MKASAPIKALALLAVAAACGLAAGPGFADDRWVASGRSLDELLQALRHPASATSRCNAAEAIAAYQDRAIEPLMELYGNESLLVRSYVCLALSRIGPAAAPAVPALARSAGDPSDALRERVVITLAAIGPGAAEAVPVLRPMIDEGDYRLRAAAVAALVAIGNAEAVEALDDTFCHGDTHTQLVVLAALEQTPSCAARMTPTLIQAARGADYTIADHAVMLLAEAGPEGLVTLDEMLAAEDPQLRRRAAMALSQVSPSCESALPALAACLTDPDSAVRFWAVKALGHGGPAARFAIPQLLDCLADADADVRWQTALALARLGLDPHSATSLAALKSDPHPTVRKVAGELLKPR